MKKLILLLLLIPAFCYGAAGDVKTVNGVAVTSVKNTGEVVGTSVKTLVGTPYSDGDVVGFCVGTELFCEDFEGTDTTWDATTGNVDCDGYDADGDYCDDETTVYKVGAESFGARGAATAAYVRENFASADQGEFYIETWWYTTGVSGLAYGPGIWTSGALHVCVITNNWGTIQIFYKGGNVLDTGDAANVNTWYYFGLYYKAETAAGANDGIVRVWMNTDGSTFATGNLIYENEAVDTGSVAEGYGGDYVQINGPLAGAIGYTDNLKIVSGAPSWTH